MKLGYGVHMYAGRDEKGSQKLKVNVFLIYSGLEI